MPTAIHGKDARLYASKSAISSSDDISKYMDKENLPRVRDVYDVTTQGAASKEYISGLTDATFSFGGPFIANADVKFSEWMEENELNFEWYPAGVGTRGTGTTAKPFYKGKMFFTEYSLDCNVGDKVTVTAAAQITGAPERVSS